MVYDGGGGLQRLLYSCRGWYMMGESCRGWYMMGENCRGWYMMGGAAEAVLEVRRK